MEDLKQNGGWYLAALAWFLWAIMAIWAWRQIKAIDREQKKDRLENQAWQKLSQQITADIKAWREQNGVDGLDKKPPEKKA